MANKNDKLMVIVTLILMILGAYYLLPQLGLAADNVVLGFFLGIIGGGLSVLAIVVLSIFLLIALFLPIENYGRFMVGLLIIVGVVAYFISPIDFPTPIDDIVVGVVGSMLSVRAIGQSTEKKPEAVIPQF